MAAGSVSGLASGLQTDEIIAKMVEYAQRPIKLIQNRQAGYTAKLAVWQEANARLLALKMKAGDLSAPTGFKGKTASVPEGAGLAATAGLDAVPGAYTITVNRLAQAEQRQSQGYADTGTAVVGTGAITVGVGAAAKSITMDATNNTLAGLRDAINRAGAGVTASITDVGSLNAHDYRLVVTSNTTGSANGITWNATLTGGTEPAWTTLTAAGDASITLGSGSTATTITKSGNTIKDVLPGITLNLKTADVAKPVTLTVSADTAQVKTRIKDFVAQFNGTMAFMNQQFRFDPETGESGTLLGDYTLQNVQQELREKVLGVAPGLPSAMNSLMQVGFSSDSRDNLVLDEAALDAALAANPEGVMRLFSATGQTTDYSVSYVSSSSATQATGATAYKIRVDQPATQSRLTAGVAQSQPLAAKETLNINGALVKLETGMTPQQVLDTINAASAQTGVTAARTGADGTGTGDYLTFTRTRYGADGSIKVTSDVSNGGTSPQAHTTGFGLGRVALDAPGGETGTGTGSVGKDVAGAFGVTTNGVTTWETATGNGQSLTGKAGNKNTDGLQVLVRSQTAGEHGEVTLTRGTGAVLNQLLDFLTGKDGSVSSAQDTLTRQIEDLRTDITSKTERITRYENKLRLQFIDLEGKMGKMQSQNAYLSAQFQAMNKSK